MISRTGIRPILCLLSIAVFAACGPNEGTGKCPQQPAVSRLDAPATARFSALLSGYFELKNALAATQSDKAARAARNMLLQVDSLRGMLLTQDSSLVAQDSLMQQMDTMKTSLSSISATTDESCEIQRVSFRPLSAALYDALKLIGMQHITAYHTFCPMAFREKGAFWLSEFPGIKNPYFGAKMIECGEVIDTIQ